MLNTKFGFVLSYNPINLPSDEHQADLEQDGEQLKRIKFHTFEKSKETMKYIKEAGLENEIGASIVTEKNFKIRKIVGYGATSVVYKATMQTETPIKKENKKPVNQKKKEQVAVKMIKNVFQNEIYAHRVLRELRLLRLLKGHNNVSRNLNLDKVIDCETQDNYEATRSKEDQGLEPCYRVLHIEPYECH